jgi:acyl carrier protein
MGLDSVELVLTVEETFGLSIPDDDAVEIDTVGKLYDYILTHRFQGKQEACLSSVTFYKIRCAMMAVLNIPRKDLRLSTKLSTLIPKHRHWIWNNLEKTAALIFPKLKRPFWVNMLIILLGGGVTMWLVKLCPQMPLSTSLCLSFILFCIIGVILIFLATPLESVLQANCATVGDLTKSVLAKNYGKISKECDRVNAAELWDSLCSIVTEQLGGEKNQLTKDTNFVRDLGMDS